MGTTYITEIDLRTRGSFLPHGLEGKLSQVNRGLVVGKANADSLSSSLMNGLKRIESVAATTVSTIARIGAHAGFAGAVAGIGAVTYGVMGLNKQLEATKLSLGSIFMAQGKTPNIDAGVELAGQSVIEMRKLAAKLPGEFSDLLNIMSTTAVPAFRAGMGLEQHRNVSAQLMAAGVVASMPLDQVAREAAQLLEGRAGAHNVLGMRLMGLHGESATQFNQMGADERLERLSTELAKYAPAIDKFANSFEGLSSTALDNAKEWLRAMTEPLFDSAKTNLQELNTWLTENEALVSSWADYLGSNLVEGFEATLDIAKEIGPVITGGIRDGIDLLKEYGPIAKDIGQSVATLAGELANPTMLAALALLSPKTRLLGVAGGAFAATSGLTDPQSDSWWRRPLGYRTDAPELEINGAQTALTFAQQSALQRNADGSVAGFDLTGDSRPKWRGRSIMAGQEESFVDQMFSFSADRKSESWWTRPLGSDQMDTRDLQLQMKPINDMLEQFAAGFEETSSYEQMEHALDSAREAIAADTRIRLSSLESLSSLEQWVLSLTGSSVELNTALNDLALGAFQASFALRAAGEQKASEIADDAQESANLFGLMNASQALTGLGGKDDKKKKEPHGPSGTKIQKVEIVVTTNQEPTRVARLVKKELLDVSRRTSKRAPNFSDAEH